MASILPPSSSYSTSPGTLLPGIRARLTQSQTTRPSLSPQIGLSVGPFQHTNYMGVTHLSMKLRL